MIWMHNHDWKPKSDFSDFSAEKDSEIKIKEQWTVSKVLRRHMGDVCDMCWSPDGSKLLSGSVDNTAILWDVIKGMNN
jgi:chromatin assembly factor 1 subunit B